MKIGHTDTFDACNKAKVNKDKTKKVFDWLKAVEIIKANSAKEAYAGLAEDWLWTGDIILCENEPVLQHTHPYLSSVWATPVIILNEQKEGIECWCWENEHNWISTTLWPQEALDLLKRKE